MKKVFLYVFVFSCAIAFAQDRKISVREAVFGYFEDPSNPKGYHLLYSETKDDLRWITNTQNYLYNTHSSFEVYSADNQPVMIIDGSKMASLYGIKRMPSIIYIDDKEMVFEFNNIFESYNYLDNSKLYSIKTPENAENKDYNSHQKKVAYTFGNNLFIASVDSEKIAVTSHSDASIIAGKSIHRNEFGIKKGTFWSPKGNFLAFYQKNEKNVTDYPLVDITTTPATLKNIKYPMVGQKSEQASIGIFDAKTLKTIYLDIDTTDEHYLTNLSWSPDEKYVLVAEINRDQNHYWLNRYDVSTGKKVNTIFEEKNEKWVEPEHSAVFLPTKNDEFLWLSERSGFMNVYHYTTSGKLVRQLTDFKWVIDKIIGFDEKGKSVIISGTGADPRQKHIFKIEIANPKKISQLTKETGTHKVQLSSNGKFLLDEWNSISIPNKIDVITTESGSYKNIFTAENPFENIAIGTTELVELKADDGTTLYGKIHKPKNFNPTKKYPVLVYVYGGPHAQEVTNSWLAGSYIWMPVFAENEQYIVFTIDNRGSANRGFAFESAIHRRLGEMEVSDQLKGVTYLKSMPYVDEKRLSVHGWSFGGFMASSLMLRHPNVFTTSVAGGAVTDWNFYEIMYGERYMDTPTQNPEGYANSRVGKYLGNLSGKLLFIHGSVDDVVVPQHVMSILRESVSKNKLVDMFIYPMHGHGVSGADHANLVERILEYIKINNR